MPSHPGDAQHPGVDDHGGSEAGPGHWFSAKLSQGQFENLADHPYRQLLSSNHEPEVQIRLLWQLSRKSCKQRLRDEAVTQVQLQSCLQGKSQQPGHCRQVHMTG